MKAKKYKFYNNNNNNEMRVSPVVKVGAPWVAFSGIEITCNLVHRTNSTTLMV